MQGHASRLFLRPYSPMIFISLVCQGDDQRKPGFGCRRFTQKCHQEHTCGVTIVMLMIVDRDADGNAKDTSSSSDGGSWHAFRLLVAQHSTIDCTRIRDHTAGGRTVCQWNSRLDAMVPKATINYNGKSEHHVAVTHGTMQPGMYYNSSYRAQYLVSYLSMQERNQA